MEHFVHLERENQRDERTQQRHKAAKQIEQQACSQGERD